MDNGMLYITRFRTAADSIGQACALSECAC